MQISGGAGAVRNINAIDPARPTRRHPSRSGARGGDTVSISEEALELFRISSLQAGTEADADTAAKFLQALEEAWNSTESGESSLFAKLRSALGAWKTEP